MSTLYLRGDPAWDAAVTALNPANQGKRFLTPSGKVEIFTPEIDAEARRGRARRAAGVLYAPGSDRRVAHD